MLVPVGLALAAPVNAKPAHVAKEAIRNIGRLS